MIEEQDPQVYPQDQGQENNNGQQRYPSPSSGQMRDGVHPFYGPQHGSEHHTPQEVPDDLQLRADLSRSLAPIMNSANPEIQQLQHDIPPPSHDQHGHHLRMQMQFMRSSPVYDSGMTQNAMAEALQQHQQQMGMQMDEHTPSADPQGPDSAKKDKRTKVSRACDECRRKKSSTSLTLHSYIKELADRLNSLESHLHPQGPPHMQHQHHQQQQQQHAADIQDLQQQMAFAVAQQQAQEGQNQVYPPPSDQVQAQPGRKRTRSVSEGYQNQNTFSTRLLYDEGPYLGAQRQFNYGDLASQVPQSSPEARNQYATQGPQPFFSSSIGPGRRESVSVPYEADPGPVVNVIDWDEDVIDE
ncbi:Glucose-responsive transcription factor [Elasticomyces elasticus]|nr:Glucose-responsive transcription factor [Elasticomyces elasticus]